MLGTKPSFGYARQAFSQRSSGPSHLSWSVPERQLFINVTRLLVRFLSHFFSEALKQISHLKTESRFCAVTCCARGRWALGAARGEGEDNQVTPWPGTGRINSTWARRTCLIRRMMNAIWSCQFSYTLSEGRTRVALITPSKHRLPAQEPDEWEQIQNSFISLTDRTFLWNSALKTFYISVSFTHCCGHSYLCKPGNAAWPIYHNLWIGEDSQGKNLYVSFLKAIK